MLRVGALLFLRECCCFVDDLADIFFDAVAAAAACVDKFGTESESLLSLGVTNGGDSCDCSSGGG